jgi:DNA-binding TFAR19-related protein (PDSD5 family)
MPASRQRPAGDMKTSRKPDDRSREEKRRAAFLKQRLTQRVRDLMADLMADKADVGTYVESQCLKVAELTAGAEELRTRLTAMLTATEGATQSPTDAEVHSLAALINATTRLESTVRRAAADLAKTAGTKPKLTLLEQKLRKDGKL